MKPEKFYEREPKPHIFSPEEESMALQILESLQTAKEAAEFLLRVQEQANGQFIEMAELLKVMLDTIQQSAVPYREKLSVIKLPLACQCMKQSLDIVRNLQKKDDQKCRMKLEFELIPSLQNAYLEFYFWAYVYSHADREKTYYEQELPELCTNTYIDQSKKTGQYKYDVSFVITAYNKLEYTRMCVESLLKNIPSGLNYELILWDNGSSDGTQAYFESKKPDKLLESRTNWAVGSLSHRVLEGKYCSFISNDVIILPNAIENMLKCIQSDDRIAWVVPSTPNVSNLQTIPAQYQSLEEMSAFAEQNNILAPNRWEERVRLCDPMSLLRSDVFFSYDGLHTSGYFSENPCSFPDDRTALLLRRRGYKMVLAKDAYCHHFGSVTLKDEIRQQNEQKFYLEGRQAFFQQFNVDPWGTGFCYDTIFLNRIVGDEHGHVEVLGINCGMGSNSLKIKEQIKEYCHNTDCILTNITDDNRFILDLKGVSDIAAEIHSIKEFKKAMYQRRFHYIVWETSFLTQYKFGSLLTHCFDCLVPNGSLLIKLTGQSLKTLQSYPNKKALNEEWIMLTKDAAV